MLWTILFSFTVRTQKLEWCVHHILSFTNMTLTDIQYNYTYMLAAPYLPSMFVGLTQGRPNNITGPNDMC